VKHESGGMPSNRVEFLQQPYHTYAMINDDNSCTYAMINGDNFCTWSIRQDLSY
jgi:hypothetical protein